jgi:hypothetical protein
VIRELNPNHRVTSTVHDHWHKVVAILLHKFSKELGREVRIYPADIEALEHSGVSNVVIEDRDGALRLRLVDDEEGKRLARKEGGLPS